MQGLLALEDGTLYAGAGFGASGVQTGEIVFNTSMTGYQEILTDPSYYRQIITMTVPHVGNTGINTEDVESSRSWVSGFVVRSLSPIVSNWRNHGDLDGFLREQGVIGLSGVATRALVRHIREKGVMRAAIAHGEAANDPQALIEMARQSLDMSGANLVDDVTCDEAYNWNRASDDAWYLGAPRNHTDGGPLVVAYDLGIKHNILRMLTDRGLRVRVVPAQTPASEVLAQKPAGVFLSNGPGDPAAVGYAIDNVRNLLGKVPVFGICLGHQILGLALGGHTEKMRFGHRGGNQPVKNLLTNVVEISAHNHGFAVTPDSDLGGAEVTHVNLNDNTVEGLRHTGLGAFSVQYHPESSPGPHDSLYLFDQFVDAVRANHLTAQV
ncbi:MAG: glutamine-hydrolyzing carbamoyl-phosphate synthase small subunit [Anaerolineae bacterium]|nr:carbamoyl-phosphate synthase small subunit [Chloroflexota bacterium]MBV6437294.1 Carbamoyl-phosphate synthase small chain [Anaerolineae bacterium]MDL1915349.1 glutamine-hydrolyzing carbamoyl-phosphate synthase small subunit [Anaerolineae bacterium CFX4]OQY79480.1 MAG: carbamoyl phosphate synthase small subunit [Anaerolineae bacterium UTCFX5]MBW7878032.1 glutamine-hydrolyzing carbamoyl-phosphate synthase small subunit [Anaerolineae bacterium]